MSDAYPTLAVFLVVAVIGAALCLAPARRARPSAGPAVGIGTVCTVTGPITVEVESVSGQRFMGWLRQHADGSALSDLRPGVVLLVTFDPQARERVSLADDMTAVRAEFDRMLVGKGLLEDWKLELIRHGTKSRGVVTAMRTTGAAHEDYREVEIDLMVRRPEGGQFPAHETTLVPASALTAVSPGSLVDAYYRRGDETAVAVCVPPR